MKAYQIFLAGIFLLLSTQPALAIIGCELEPSVLSAESELQACYDDNTITVIDLTTSSFEAEDSAFVVVDITEEIRGIYSSNSIAIEELGIGDFSIHHILWNAEITDFTLGKKLFDVGGCYVLSNAVEVSVEYCLSECQAFANAPVFPEFACGGAVEVTGSANAAYPSYYVLLNFSQEVIDVSSNGSFDSIPKGDYLVSLLNTTEVLDPEQMLGQSQTELTADLDCFAWADGSQVLIALDSIRVVLDEDCDPETGTFTLTVSFQGGLPWYDFESWYNVEGSSLSGQFGFDEGITLEFVQNQTFEFSVSDDSNCPAVEVSGAPEPCIKFIDLQEFFGEAFVDFNKLSWNTESEEGVDYFEITRSENGVSYEAIAQVQAVGNSNVLQSYTYNDMESGVTEAPLLYYQLIIYSLNGETENSEIVIIQRVPGTGIEEDNDLGLVLDWTNRSLTANKTLGVATLQMFDQQGQLIQEEKLEIDSGVNSIGLGNHLPAGLYFYRLQVGSQFSSGKCYLH